MKKRRSVELGPGRDGSSEAGTARAEINTVEGKYQQQSLTARASITAEPRTAEARRRLETLESTLATRDGVPTHHGRSRASQADL